VCKNHVTLRAAGDLVPALWCALQRGGRTWQCTIVSVSQFLKIQELCASDMHQHRPLIFTTAIRANTL
jgi:hypothetical protein